MSMYIKYLLSSMHPCTQGKPGYCYMCVRILLGRWTCILLFTEYFHRIRTRSRSRFVLGHATSFAPIS
jgi:hypothetical protein